MIINDDNALAKVLRLQIMLLKDGATLDLHLAQRRAPLQACPLVKNAVYKLQPLRVRLNVVGEAVDNGVAIGGNGACGAHGRGKQSGRGDSRCCGW